MCASCVLLYFFFIQCKYSSIKQKATKTIIDRTTLAAMEIEIHFVDPTVCLKRNNTQGLFFKSLHILTIDHGLLFSIVIAKGLTLVSCVYRGIRHNLWYSLFLLYSTFSLLSPPNRPDSIKIAHFMILFHHILRFQLS